MKAHWSKLAAIVFTAVSAGIILKGLFWTPMNWDSAAQRWFCLVTFYSTIALWSYTVTRRHPAAAVNADDDLPEPEDFRPVTPRLDGAKVRPDREITYTKDEVDAYLHEVEARRQRIMLN